MNDDHVHVTETNARAAEKTGRVRYILGISIVAAALALGIVVSAFV